MNEKEVKDAANERRSRNAICSVTGTDCVCIGKPGRGCQALQPKLDAPSREVVRELKTARLYLEATKFRLEDALGGEELLTRRYPNPEIREIRRKVVTAIAMIDEIGGEL